MAAEDETPDPDLDLDVDDFEDEFTTNGNIVMCGVNKSTNLSKCNVRP